MINRQMIILDILVEYFPCIAEPLLYVVADKIDDEITKYEGENEE